MEHHAYDRAANRAKSYAEHWEREARTTGGDNRALAQLKAGHWRIIEKEIRGLAQPDEGEQNARQ